MQLLVSTNTEHSRYITQVSCSNDIFFSCNNGKVKMFGKCLVDNIQNVLFLFQSFRLHNMLIFS